MKIRTMPRAEVNQTLERRVQERNCELIQAQTMLIESAKMAALGEMAGGVAHEINPPLATIILSAERIKEPTEERDLAPERADAGSLRAAKRDL